MNIAINGFGRIGRATFKSIVLNSPKGIKVVAINDLTDTKTLAHLLKYDSAYGTFPESISATSKSIKVGSRSYDVFCEKNPENLPWEKLKVDVVIDCTGIFMTTDSAGLHLKAGAKKVIISAPVKDEKIKTIVMGVNEEKIKKSDNILSNASCTTNCLAPITEVVRQNFGIQKAIMTTIHSYTVTQNLVDGPHKDLRRGRAAAYNILPTTTGAAIAVSKVIPQLKGKIDGMAVRVPTQVGSMVDVVFLTRKKVTKESANNAFKKASKSSNLKDILEVSNEPLVLSDFVGNPASSIVDLEMTNVVDGNLLKVIAWYDNEWGYSCRLVDLAEYLMKKKFV